MAAPTLTAEYEVATWDTVWPNTVSVTTAVGDRLVLAAMNEGYQGSVSVIQAPTGGTGLTWTLVGQINVTNYGVVAVWTATATVAETFNASVALASGGSYGGLDVVRFSAASSDGFGANAVGNVDNVAPSLAITTQFNNSSIVFWSTDWNATDGAARTWRAVNGAPTELVYNRSAANATFYGSLYPDAGLAGAKTVGLSAPGAQRMSAIAVEVRGTAGGPPPVTLPYGFFPHFD